MDPNQYYGYDQPVYTNQSTDNSAKMKRMIYGGIGLLLFLTLLIIVLSSLFSSPSIRPQVAKIAAMHNEIARVAELGVESPDARRATQVIATNVRAISLTNVTQLTLWANDNFTNDFTKNTLSTQLNEATDAALLEAGDVNNYDEVFREAMLILLQGANDEITAQFNLFSDQPGLQNILNTVGEANQDLIESISFD